jgi:hypothetical protein
VPSLELTHMHLQHPGLPESVEGFYAAAAAVCLQRHHRPPHDIEVVLSDNRCVYGAEWRQPSVDEQRSFADKTDATCFGAYTVALAAAFAHLGLKAVGRSGTGSGSDWYLLPADAEVDASFLEHPQLLRLEVSGSDDIDPWILRRRRREKVDQARRGHSTRPAYAAVVIFPTPVVSFERS